MMGPRLPRLLTTLLAASFFLTACGPRQDPIDASSRPAAPIDRVGTDAAADLATITQFSLALADSPHWSTVRRFRPPTYESLIASSPGFVRGVVTSVSVGPAQSMTAEELLGVGVELQPEVKEGVPSEGAQTPPTLSIQSVTLDITVTDSSEDGASDGMSAKVPLAAWSSADGGDAQRQAVADVVASMAKFVPVGTEVVVITQSLVPSGPDTVTIQTPGSSLFGGPASVVFASSDSGLVSLDWAVGDDAESYLGAASLDEFVAQVFGRR